MIVIPFFEALFLNAGHVGKVSYRHDTLIRKSEFDGESCVVSLDGSTGPAAISWFVVSVYIFAIKRLSFWGVAHVFKEGGKGVEPPLAHFDAASAIVFVLRIRLGIAPRFCMAPCLVFTRCFRADSWISAMTVFEKCATNGLISMAPAGQGIASGDSGDMEFLFGTAIAFANPFVLPLLVDPGKSHKSQPIESLTFDEFGSHDFYYATA